MDGGQAIVVRGLRAAQRHVAEPGERVDDRIELAKRLLPVMYRAEAERWVTRGFGAWPELARSTTRRHGSHATMRLTGALLASLLAPDALKPIPSGWEYGTPIYYARFHQEGEGTPKRVVIGLRRIDREAIRDAIEQYVAEGT